MILCQFVADRDCFEAAEALLASYGNGALAEAMARAALSRDRGNHIHYTRWCRVGRTILLLGEQGPAGLLH